MHGRCSVKLVVSLAHLVIYQAPEPLCISGPDDSTRGEFIGLGPLFWCHSILQLQAIRGELAPEHTLPLPSGFPSITCNAHDASDLEKYLSPQKIWASLIENSQSNMLSPSKDENSGPRRVQGAARILYRSMAWPLTFLEKPHPERAQSQPSGTQDSALDRSREVRAPLDSPMRRAVGRLQQAKGGCRAHLYTVQLAPAS